MKKAATIIELLIVMGIVTILFGVGITGILFIRATVEFETSRGILNQEIDNIANMARNSLAVNQLDTPDYWGFQIESNTLSVIYCYENGIFLDCTIKMESVVLSNVDISFQQQCSGIVFETTTSKFLAIQDTVTYRKINSGICQINVSHTNGLSATVLFNIENNFIEK